MPREAKVCAGLQALEGAVPVMVTKTAVWARSGRKTGQQTLAKSRHSRFREDGMPVRCIDFFCCFPGPAAGFPGSANTMEVGPVG